MCGFGISSKVTRLQFEPRAKNGVEISVMLAYFSHIFNNSIPEGDTINSLLFYAHAQNVSECWPCFWTDSKCGSRFKNFEKKLSATALWLDENL